VRQTLFSTFTDQEDISIDTQYVKITLAEFPGKIAVISRLKKETFVTGNKGELIKSHVIPQCTVNIPEGAVNPGTMLDLQVSGSRKLPDTHTHGGLQQVYD
jgi:hypothetical protein